MCMKILSNIVYPDVLFPLNSGELPVKIWLVTEHMGYEIKPNQINLYITQKDLAFSLLFQEDKNAYCCLFYVFSYLSLKSFHVISKFSSYFLFTVPPDLQSISDNILIFTPRNLHRKQLSEGR